MDLGDALARPAMTLVEALQALRTRSATSAAAYDHVRKFASAVVQKHCGLRDSDLDDAVSTTLIEVVRALELGRFDPQVEPVARAYVFRAARNAARSLLRARKRDRARTDRDKDVDALTAMLGGPGDDDWEEDPDIVRARVRALARECLDRLLERALQRRKPANRPHLQQAYEQLTDVRFGDARVDDFVLELAPEAATDESLLKRTRDRLYKAHERCRSALREALADLNAEGCLSFEEAAQAEACLRLL